MSFKHAQYQQSMAILGMPGAEKLSGKGAMLFIPPGKSEPMHLQGAYIHKDEVKEIVDMLLLRHAFTRSFKLPERELPDLYDDTGMTVMDQSPDRQAQGNKELCRIILWALGRDTVAAMQIKQSFHMGNRANSILEQLTNRGIVDNKYENKPRTVLPQRIEDLSDEAIDFLLDNGISKVKIAEAILQKPDPNVRKSDIAGVSENLRFVPRKKLAKSSIHKLTLDQYLKQD